VCHFLSVRVCVCVCVCASVCVYVVCVSKSVCAYAFNRDNPKVLVGGSVDNSTTPVTRAIRVIQTQCFSKIEIERTRIAKEMSRKERS
jgi:hypothetical protein